MPWQRFNDGMGNEWRERTLRELGLENATTREVLEAFEASLHQQRWGRANHLAGDLAHRGGPEVEQVVMRMLATPLARGYRDHNVAWLAGRLRIEAAVPLLVEALPDPAADSRFHHQFAHAALAALGTIGLPEADRAVAAYLRALVASPHARLCHGCLDTAVRSAGRHPGAERVTALRDLVRDERFELWSWDAAFHLVPIADERFTPFFVELLVGPCPAAGLAGLERVATRRARAALIALLHRNPSRRARHQAARAMLLIHGRDDSEPWPLLQSPDPVCRRVAAHMLGRMRPQHVNSYYRLLEDRDARVRGAAATSFGLLAEPRVVRPLVPLLDDPSHDVRARTATALARIAAVRVAEGAAGAAVAGALPRLREMAAADPVPCVRDAAASALRRIGRHASDASSPMADGMAGGIEAAKNR